MCDPIDAPDLRCLNMDHTPTANPLAKLFHLKSYNKVWFSQDTTKPPCKFDYSSQPKFAIDSPINDHFPIMAKLSQGDLDYTGTPTKQQFNTIKITTDNLAASIITSIDKHFLSVI